MPLHKIAGKTTGLEDNEAHGQKMARNRDADICGYSLSDHAVARMSERGISRDTVALVVTFADSDLHAGNGCHRLGIRTNTLQELEAEGVSPAEIGRIENVAVIAHHGAATIVTVMHDCGRRNDWYGAEDAWTTRGRYRVRGRGGRHGRNRRQTVTGPSHLRPAALDG